MGGRRAVSCTHVTQKVILFSIFAENVSCTHMTLQRLRKRIAAPGGLVGAGGRSRDARPFKRSVNGPATEHHSRYQSPHARCDPPTPSYLYWIQVASHTTSHGGRLPTETSLGMSLISFHANALAQATKRAAFGRSHGIRCAAAAAEAH